MLFAGTTTEASIVNHSINLVKKATSPPETAASASSGPGRKISGTVLDSNGEPIIGATVMVDGTSNGVGVDLDGNYTLAKVPDGAVIRFSCLGYVDLVKPYKGEKRFNAILYEDSESLEEAVAVAFGTQRKESVVGAVTSIKPDQLKAPTSNLTTALAGNIAGIISYQRSGEPGADDASFFIRGITTFGANTNPLILIDNVELTTTDLARLQPDDIESFSIMKDATATALYGSRAANGVILVKTKEGRKSKAKVNVRYEHSFSQPTQEIELEADPQVYMRLHNEAIKSREPSAPLPYSEDKIRNTTASSNSYLYPYTNWHDTMLKRFAQSDRANMNVSGGGDVARYYVSASIDHDTGILNVEDNAFYNYNSNIDLKTYTLRSNINVNLTKSTELILRMSGVIDDYEGPINGGTGTYNQIMAANPVLFPATFPSEISPYTNHVLYGNYDT
ncbi:MAG: SusC/RagA family TonB-linked outer membrane protein, partial [Bacteroidales bacterium]|nr:SusC/RagA family TonB-linked outer membrane protein [Bacteroidales bacterium]